MLLHDIHIRAALRGGGLSAAGREPENGSWMNDFTEKESGNPLDSWDYAILEIIRRQDWFAMLGFGTMRLAKCVLRLDLRGTTHVPDRPPAFDEAERMQEFLDSPALRAYRASLKKVVTPRDQTFFDEVSAMTGFGMFEAMTGAYMEADAEMWAGDSGARERVTVLTETGWDRLAGSRARARLIYGEVSGRHAHPDFYELAGKYESELPLMVAMGMSGHAIRDMLYASDPHNACLVRM